MCLTPAEGIKSTKLVIIIRSQFSLELNSEGSKENNLANIMTRATSMALVVKNLPASAGDIRDVGSISKSGRYTGGGHCYSLQYSSLENPTNSGAGGLESIGSQRVRHD